tara:strand:+ start:750 stop:962 length:213 start_codon:yes stop_codon:yes gene_type:complete
MNSEILLQINKYIQTMVSAEVQKQIVEYKENFAEVELSEDTLLTTAQSGEVDTMIRDIINHELNFSVDSV